VGVLRERKGLRAVEGGKERGRILHVEELWYFVDCLKIIKVLATGRKRLDEHVAHVEGK
jgi:hypothetical protein